MKRYILSIILLTSMLISCTKIDLKTADTNVPVVESYIQSGAGIDLTIKKQLIFNSDDDEYEYLSGLDVAIEKDGVTYTLNNPSAGLYQDTSILIEPNDILNLTFTYNNKLVSASTTIPIKPSGLTLSSIYVEAPTFSRFGGDSEKPDPITLTYDNPDNDYHIIVVETTASSPVLINSDTNMPSRSFRSIPLQGSEQEINPMQFSYYGKHRVIVYRINAEYAALYEQMELTSLDIESPPSNVENGLGIFTGVNSDTTYVYVVD